MATFSVNQVRHLYVTNKMCEPTVTTQNGVGAISVEGDKANSYLYFKYIGAGGPIRSDLIPTKNVEYVTATHASKQAIKLKSYKVTLDEEVTNETVSGQDYILRIIFKKFMSLSEEDQYFKHASVHAYAGMSASDFYKKLALSLAKNFSRESSPMLKIELEGGAEVKPTTKLTELNGTYTGVILTELPQPWVRGKMPQTTVDFEVQPSTIVYQGDEVVWGKVEKNEVPDTIKNGQMTADLEYFCMGERGDLYRGAGYPHNLDTEYLVDPKKEYHTITIQYFFSDEEGRMKSQKTLVIVSHDQEVINGIIDKVNEKTGLTTEHI